MVASTQTTNTKIFALIAVLVFKLLSRKILFVNRIMLLKSKFLTIETLEKDLLFKKITNLPGKLLQNSK